MADLQDLAGLYGTPSYIYRKERVARAGRDLRDALPRGARLYYSLKANPHPDLVAELTGLGLHAEVSSTGELDAALEGGQLASGCLYSGPGKTWNEVLAAVHRGVRLFSVESLTDRRRLDDIADTCRVEVECLVRLNGSAETARSGLRMTGRSSQFGTDVDSAELAELFEPSRWVRPIGAHVYAASNIADEKALLDEFASSARTVAATLAAVGFTPALVDLGGGFGAPFAVPGERTCYRALREGLEAILDDTLPGWRVGVPQIAFESGRYLVADSGALLTTVLDVKRSRGVTYVVLDAGVNVLGGMSGTGRLLAPGAQPLPGTVAGADASVTLAGPLCTPLDVLSRGACMPEPRPGDVLQIPNVGAYGLTASLLGFLSRPVATEVVLTDTDATYSARRLQLTNVYRSSRSGPEGVQ